MGRGRKERGEKKGKGEMWARREEEGEVRWESTRDSFYISCRNANFGNRRRARKAVGIVVLVVRNLVVNALLFLPILDIYRPPQVLENPTIAVICPARWRCGDRSQVFAPAVLRALQTLAFLGMQSDQRMCGRHPNLQCRRTNDL